MEMTLELAKKIIEGAKAKASEMGIPQNVAVVDAGGNLVAHERMDGAMIAGIVIAQDKAYTAAATTFATDALGGLAQPGQLAYGLAQADRGRMVIFAGGVPIKVDGKCIGAVGVSGGLAPDDKVVAEAGIAAAFGSQTPEAEHQEHHDEPAPEFN